VLRAWVFRIATNLALSELRRRRLRDAGALDDTVLEIPDPRPIEVHEMLEAEERSRMVAAGLRELSDEHRAVFLLRVRHEMEVRDIARALCIPEGTVKSRIHHAVRKLRAFAQRWDCEGADERTRHDMR
jgi:RNA polymerase sigma-70 factor (ECF subfamily)